MKKIGITLLTAMLGGLIAVGGYKLFENRAERTMSFEERQQLHYANNPSTSLNITASTGYPDFTEAAAQVTPAVVHITTTYPARAGRSRGMDPFEELFPGFPFFGEPRQRGEVAPPKATGSGVIISTDGYIVTNNHVVEGADKIEVKLTDRRVMEAKIIGRDPRTDIALIKINEKNLPFVKLGNSDNVRIGEWVLAVGYPLGLESTVTAGIVSAIGRSTDIISNDLLNKRYQMDPNQQLLKEGIESFIQTDAVINKGNSGGALVNAKGELVGINSNIMSPSGYYAGYGFAVPVYLVKKIADDFVKFGMVKRGIIGVTFQALTPELAKELNISENQGLLVNEVMPGSAGEKAGLKKGDIITKYEGKVIFDSQDLTVPVYRLRPGDKIRVTIKRDGKEREVSMTLQEEEKADRSSSGGTETAKSATELYNKLGAGFVPADENKRKELGINSGVVVTQVHQGGLFDHYGIRRGLVITEINGQPVNNVDDIEKALGKSNRNMIHIVAVPQKGSRAEFTLPINF
jgi:serine protease Do